MAVSGLPWWLLLSPGALEPAALLWGAFILFSNPQDYVNRQVPSKIPMPLSAGSTSITLMLGNVFLLLAAIAILCCFTKYGSISRNYLLIIAFADLGHIYSSYGGMGSDYFWNDMAWGNISTSTFLCVNRILTAFGLFGTIGGSGKAKRN